MSSFKDKLKKLFSLQAIRAKWAEWAPLMPAKSHLSAEYTFPQGRYAGQPRTDNFPYDENRQHKKRMNCRPGIVDYYPSK
ncbi:hypothetical protein DTO166G4_1777 [Paecilomyces variotii]|nr:hypothetical protein DTO166G4_1777 [Paecilomyces variotii]KAJ9239533.1 hypothetical protein DTO166G5_2280 [Paecilomyces variotii]KAJ9358956.1 hypothetical protein DTO027B9_2251 [Paecilomyces variotii]KAJ9402395.1 hypothetical protein DTO282F9_591 [Paecilomyces variotii]